VAEFNMHIRKQVFEIHCNWKT